MPINGKALALQKLNGEGEFFIYYLYEKQGEGKLFSGINEQGPSLYWAPKSTYLGRVSKSQKQF